MQHGGYDPNDPEELWQDEPLRARARRKKLLKILGWMSVALLIVLIALAVPIYAAFKNWRASVLGQEALDLMAGRQPDYIQAYQKAMAGYALSRTEIAPLRAVAQVYEAAKKKGALRFRRAVIEHPESDLDDRLRYLGLALKLGEMDVAAEQIQWFQEHAPDEAKAQLLRVEFWLRSGEAQKAMDIMRTLLAHDEASDQEQLFYIQLSLEYDLPDERARTLKKIQTMLDGYEPLSLMTARLVANDPDLPSHLRELALLRLKNHPDAQLLDKLKGLQILFSLGDMDAAQLFERAEALFEQDDTQALLIYLRWLNTFGFYEHASSVISPDEALGHRDLFIAYVDALAGSGDWANVYELLKDPKRVPLPKFYRALYLTRYYYEMSRIKDADISWNQAVLLISKEPEGVGYKLWLAQAYAKQMGWVGYERLVLEKLMMFPSEQRKAFERLILLEREHGGLQDVIAVYKRMLSVYAEDPAVVNDYAYLRLLAGVEIPEAMDSARVLVRKEPQFLACHITLALGYLRLNEPERALAVLQQVSVNWLNVPDPHKVVAIAVLQRQPTVTAENREKIQTLLAQVNPQHLMAEERQLLQF